MLTTVTRTALFGRPVMQARPAGFGDPIVWTPTAIAAEVDKAKVFLGQLNDDVNRQGLAAQLGWDPFYNEFLDWLASDPSTWWYSTVDKAKEFVTRAQQYRAKMLTLTVVDPTTGEKHAATTTTPNDPSPPGKPSDVPWKWIIGGSVALVGLLVLGPVIRDLVPSRQK